MALFLLAFAVLRICSRRRTDPAGQPFGALRAAELGLVTSVVADQKLLATATETAQTLAEKPGGAVQASKRLMKGAYSVSNWSKL